MTHLSYENYDYSRMVAKKALIGLNKYNSDEIMGYLGVISNILILRDSFMYLRTEWILGLPNARIEIPTYQTNSQNNNLNYKMGLSILKNVNDEICEYRSTAFKSSSSSKESFLQMLYQYRKRQIKFTLDCLVVLLQACLSDFSGYLYFFLYTMDPPASCYGRYIDWIKPYLHDHIDTCMRNC